MDNAKIIAFLKSMSDRLEIISEGISENGCNYKTIEGINYIIGDALAIKSVVSNKIDGNYKPIVFDSI